MNIRFRRKYLRSINLSMRNTLKGKNKIMAMNTWVVSLMRYAACVVSWTKNRLEESHRKSDK